MNTMQLRSTACLPAGLMPRSGPACGLPFRPAQLGIKKGLNSQFTAQILKKSSRSRRNVVSCRSEANLIEKVTTYYDTEKEQSRRFRQTVFSHEDWFKHRSTSRYSRHLLGLFESRIIRGLTWPAGLVVSISTFLVAYEYSREWGYLPPWCSSLVVSNAAPFNLTSFALSLLLVFRTNASYARWDNARKIWGGVVNRTRDLSRQGLTWLNPENQELIDMLQRWVTTYPRTLKSHLTYDSDLRAELKDVLQEEELEALLRSPHRPNYAVRMIAEVIRNANLTKMEVFLMDANLSLFADYTGGCERIFKTPIPLSWTRHTSRFLMVWLIFLPLIIYQTCHWATPFIGATIAVALLACDEISVTLEEPFGILPLAAICDTIQKNIKDMGTEKAEVEALIQLHSPSPSDSNGGAARGYRKNFTTTDV